MGEVKVTCLQLDGESDEKSPPEHKVQEEKTDPVHDFSSCHIKVSLLMCQLSVRRGGWRGERGASFLFMSLSPLSVLQRPALCDSLHSSVHDKENSPMMRAGET